MVFSPIAHLASLLVLSATFSQLASAQSLRNSNFKDPKGEECTIIVQSQLRLDEDDGVESESFDCVLDAIDADGVDGHSVPIDVTKQQRKILKKLFKDGDIVSDESTLKMESGFKLSKNGVHIPKNKDKFNFGKKKGGKENARRLAVVTGVKPILVVRVTDSAGLVRSESASVISDDIFGTSGDTMTLKSQMYDCSFGQLDITAGLPANPDPNEVAPGVVEVDINVSFNNPRSTVRNAVTTAVQAKLGITLPGPYQQVMYVLEGCYQDCGWAAYAYVNSWMSVYQGNYYKMVGVQMHGKSTPDIFDS